MFWTLIAAVFSGLAGAGIAMALRKLSGNRLPKGIMPVFAGIAMIAGTVAQEYSWFPNNLDDLPPDAVVLSTREQQAVYQPWTYVQPWVRGFIAFAPSETVETMEGSEVYVIQAHIRERWQPAIIRPVLVDCARELRFDIAADTTFDDEGRPEGLSPVGDGPDDPVIPSVCAAS
ncbi:hypothetical protein V8J82_05215 [Gymnodinialimonas sp. 2305UL16-5]|uniref:hypothetical protein n=1 Tax=Gymnodinialimonas mytili TaxID=3126503 RepID=UPI0030A34416